MPRTLGLDDDDLRESRRVLVPGGRGSAAHRDKMSDFTTLARSSLFEISEYRCSAAPRQTPFVEHHSAFSLSYVSRGGFGYRHDGRTFEMTPGSVLVGHPGDEYMCDHDHVHGDVCLSVRVAPALVDELDGAAGVWRVGAVPALAPLVVFGELASSAARGAADVALEEAAALLVERFATVVGGQPDGRVRVRPRERHRLIETAEWIRAHAAQPLDLDAIAAHAQFSPFHLLRLFRRTFDVTPHQYLVRSRIRRAARLLAEEDASITQVALDVGFRDLSHFVRTFRRAAGMSPREFRRLSRAGDLA